MSAGSPGATQIVVLCEGDTEVWAVRGLLKRHLQSEGLTHVSLKPINLRGKLEDVDPFVERYERELKVAAAFTLIDLYGMGRVRHGPGDSLDTKVARVLEWLNANVSGIAPGFFHPHVAVHEIEAWILAEGASLARRLKTSAVGPDPDAERKDFENPPKRRLNEMFRRYLHRRYEENRDGKALFEVMATGALYGTCHYYRVLYDDLARTARTMIHA